jgi:transcriptional regulator with XRE-family HTH domain
MDAKTEIREFLTSRRARITPEQVGLSTYGSRRVPGLRREEVAVLAGVSVPYYTRLERGEAAGVSESVLSALAGALQLDEAERAHLFDIVRAAQPASTSSPRRRRRSTKQIVRADVQQILDAMTGAAALLRNDRLDILACNQLGHALYSPVLESPIRPANTIRFVFLDPRAQEFYDNWDSAANDCVAVLRSSAGRDPYDRGTSDLVGELSTQSQEFRTRWAAHNVRFHLTGIKHFRHPAVGDISLNFNRLDLAVEPGLTIFTYTAEPGSRDEETLRLLGSWAATTDTSTQANQPVLHPQDAARNAYRH